MGKVIFITGGARSGKSSLALRLASAAAGAAGAEEEGARLAFIATAQALDDEMAGRIKRHKEDRGAGWDTFEEPLHLPEKLREIRSSYDAIVIDCLTLWLSNLTGAGRDEEAAIEALLKVLAKSGGAAGAAVVVVSNELGMGVVPAGALAREFRDRAGELNKRVAQVADEAYLTVSGIPLKIKDQKKMEDRSDD